MSTVTENTDSGYFETNGKVNIYMYTHSEGDVSTNYFYRMPTTKIDGEYIASPWTNADGPHVTNSGQLVYLGREKNEEQWRSEMNFSRNAAYDENDNEVKNFSVGVLLGNMEMPDMTPLPDPIVYKTAEELLLYSHDKMLDYILSAINEFDLEDNMKLYDGRGNITDIQLVIMAAASLSDHEKILLNNGLLSEVQAQYTALGIVPDDPLTPGNRITGYGQGGDLGLKLSAILDNPLISNEDDAYNASLSLNILQNFNDENWSEAVEGSYPFVYDGVDNLHPAGSGPNTYEIPGLPRSWEEQITKLQEALTIAQTEGGDTTELEAQIADLQTQVGVDEYSIDALQTQIDNLLSSAGDNSSEIASLQAQILQLQTDATADANADQIDRFREDAFQSWTEFIKSNDSLEDFYLGTNVGDAELSKQFMANYSTLLSEDQKLNIANLFFNKYGAQIEFSNLNADTEVTFPEGYNFTLADMESQLEDIQAQLDTALDNSEDEATIASLQSQKNALDKQILDRSNDWKFAMQYIDNLEQGEAISGRSELGFRDIIIRGNLSAEDKQNIANELYLKNGIIFAENSVLGIALPPPHPDWQATFLNSRITDLEEQLEAATGDGEDSTAIELLLNQIAQLETELDEYRDAAGDADIIEPELPGTILNYPIIAVCQI